MQRYEFKLPDVGEGVTEAEIATWHVSVGQRIREDGPLVDITTDKAVVDITSPVTGTVLALHGAVGERMAVGSLLVELDIGKHTDAVVAPVEGDVLGDSAATPLAPLACVDWRQPIKSSRGHTRQSNALAAPATRFRAKELGIELATIAGSGPDGRILRQDLEAFIAKTVKPVPRAASTAAAPDHIEINVIGIRRMIAERMQESKRRIPHFTYIEEIDLTELEAMRRALNAKQLPDRPKLTLLPFFMKALVSVVPDYPFVNARYDDEGGVLKQYSALHIGIATQTATGLMVPVVRDAQRLDIWQSAGEILRITAAAKAGTAKREELGGSTITLTSLGNMGGIAATPIINRPEVAIIGPNKLVERPVVQDGRIVIRRMMNLSASFDHRIVDGYDAASFVQRIKQLMEQPSLLFLRTS